ncbi:MAG: hemerythrin domain-containing protein [Acidiferrobacteraceae bacterium]
MGLINDYLREGHYRCDRLLEQAEEAVSEHRWARAATCLDAYASMLRCHIEAEEHILFPALERAHGGMFTPGRVMRIEHRRFEGSLAALSGFVMERDQGAFRTEAEALKTALANHNRKEEQVLYPLADRMVPPERHATLTAIRNYLEECP